MSLPRILHPWGASALGECNEQLSHGRQARQNGQHRDPRCREGSRSLCRAVRHMVRSRLGCPCCCWQGKELCSIQPAILIFLEKGLLLIPLPRAWPGPCTTDSGIPMSRHTGRGRWPPRLARSPVAERSLPGDVAACADGLGGLGSSAHLLSVQYLVFCKSRVQ